jgi:hypothetical protein
LLIKQKQKAPRNAINIRKLTAPADLFGQPIVINESVNSVVSFCRTLYAVDFLLKSKSWSSKPRCSGFGSGRPFDLVSKTTQMGIRSNQEFSGLVTNGHAESTS